MTTIEIEILRTGQSLNLQLDSGNNYIALYGADPARDFTIPCTQADFDTHAALLRYKDGDEQKRLAGIGFFQALMSRIIGQVYPEDAARPGADDFLHLRLVATPKEIAQLPFELALTPAPLCEEGMPAAPFFVNPKLKITFTREVRQASARHYKWPHQPRILFAWAQPGNTVPHDEHLDAFTHVLRPWALPLKGSPAPVPDTGALITELGNASLASIKAALAAAVAAGHPYTHVHLLAHGGKAAQRPDPFLVILNDDTTGRADYASGKDLVAALTAEHEGTTTLPYVVSLMACDSGNTGDPFNPVGSLAHALHEGGIPCVLASQFPLTQQGSVKMVTALYEQLLQSADPRAALYDTRLALDAAGTHDWASLVAYARFPEDIEGQIKDICLKILLAFLRTANALADHVIRHMDGIRPQTIDRYFDEVSQRLDTAIAELTALIDPAGNGTASQARYAEHYGLIGSAWKRKAEHLYRVAVYKNALTPATCDAAVASLKQARDWYLKGYTAHINSHWNGTQYLSLAAVLNDTIDTEANRDMWDLCRIVASIDLSNARDEESIAWACGTLAELYLLKPFVMNIPPEKRGACLEAATGYLQKLNNLQGQHFPKESTARQLERYMTWWPAMLETESAQELKALAAAIRPELPALEDLLKMQA